MDWEINWIKELYTTREALADLPLYPVRGNHDSYWYNKTVLTDLSQTFPNWHFPKYWYEKQFEIGPDGEKVALLFIDTEYMVC